METLVQKIVIAAVVAVVEAAAVAVVAAVVAAAADNSIGIVAKEATAEAAIVTIDMEITIDVAKTGAIIVNETLNQQHHSMVCVSLRCFLPFIAQF